MTQVSKSIPNECEPVIAKVTKQTWIEPDSANDPAWGIQTIIDTDGVEIRFGQGGKNLWMTTNEAWKISVALKKHVAAIEAHD